VAAGRKDVTSDSYDVKAVTTFVTKMHVGDLVVISEGNYKFRAIGEITSDYQFSNREEQEDHYGQSRSVRWLRVYQPSLPYEQLLNKIFSQQTIYELKDHAIDREKLTSLLGKPELLDQVIVEGIKIGELLRVMNQRIEVLLGRDYCLGHAYFMSLTNESSLGDLAVIFQKQIFPLLQEYFFEDWQRIQWVLNDHNKTSVKFIERREEGLIRELFGADLPIAETQLPWVINERAFFSVEAYQGILKVNV
jgi:hypothetical protein